MLIVVLMFERTSVDSPINHQIRPSPPPADLNPQLEFRDGMRTTFGGEREQQMQPKTMPPAQPTVAGAIELAASFSSLTAVRPTLAPLPEARLSYPRIGKPFINDAEPHFTSEVFEEVEGIRRPVKVGPTLAERVYVVQKPLSAGTEIGVEVLVTHLDQAGNGGVSINLCGHGLEEIFFHMSVRLWGNKQVVVFNTKRVNGNDWGEEIYKEISGVKVGMKLAVKVIVEGKNYNVFLNTKHVADFVSRSTDPTSELKRIEHFVVKTALDIVAINVPPSFTPENKVVGSLSHSLEAPTKYKNYNLLHAGNEYTVFFGILNSADNFERRWAVRRTWFQYPQFKEKRCASCCRMRFVFNGL